ncbi:MAG: hypothetical protein PVH24_02470 [Candidatus Zixiibacteriota bacterium]|jgi:hypothetical protein
MKPTGITASLALAIMVLALIGGCGSDNANPLAPFQPEIVNNQDAFQFQATDVKNVTATLHYPWQNTGMQATVNHSTALTGGIATVTIFDADSAQVYTSPLLASATEQTVSGLAGTWTVKVVLTNASGTFNFRVEKL